jgi:hypothetical protein
MLTCYPCSDYINPIDLCNRLNTYIVPEAAVHAFLTILFLINGYWIALILNLPMLAWNAKKLVLYNLFPTRRLLTRYRIFENQHLLDATEIFRKLNVHKKVSSCAAFISDLQVANKRFRNPSSSSASTSSCSSSTSTA